jgi:hypothetical protein
MSSLLFLQSWRVHERDYRGGRNEYGGHDRRVLIRMFSELNGTGGEDSEEPCTPSNRFLDKSKARMIGGNKDGGI